MASSLNSIKIYDYFDYRTYLGDYYTFRKGVDSTFSHRFFLKQAQIPGTVYLQRLINKQQHIGRGYIQNFIKALGLSKKEGNYFKALVLFSLEKDKDKKLNYLQTLLKIRSTFPAYVIDDKKLKFLQKWYYPVIRELVPIVDFKEDYNLLGRLVLPRLNAAQARNAVKYLVKHKFLTRNKKGQYIQTEPIMTTGDQVRNTVISEYHKTNLEQCIDALYSVPIEKRDVSSLVLGVSEKSYEKIRTEIQAFRKKLLAIAKEEQNPIEVCHVGFQLVPKSKNITDEGRNNE